MREFFAPAAGGLSTNKAHFDIRVRLYGYVYVGIQSAVSEPIKQELRLNTNTNLVSTEVTVDASLVSRLNFMTTETVTITQNTTSQQLYDFIVTRSNEINMVLSRP